MKKRIVRIKGMHCTSCEKILEEKLAEIVGIKNVRADSQKNIVEIYYEGEVPNFIEVKKGVRAAGYDIATSDHDPKENSLQKNTDWKEWAKAIGIVAIILFFYRLVQNLGILDRIDLKSQTITYGISVLIGLIASISTCLAVIGSLVIAFAEKYQSNGSNFYEYAVKPNLLFHLGRLITFFFLGGLLGLIGKEIAVSGNTVSVFTLIIAFVMGWLGLNILGLTPSITRLGIKMPKGLTGKWSALKESEHKAAPLLLGGLSFFLPCGFTQSMQIFALASGSFLVGGLSLFLFALGTVPALLVLGITTSWTKMSGIALFKKIAGIAIVIFAVLTFQSGLALKGVHTNVLESPQEQAVPDTKNTPQDSLNEQVVEMHITSSGFQPNILKIKKGIPVRWVIKGDRVTSCTNKIIIPSLDIAKDISYGDNIILFTPPNQKEIPFSCWMGMVRGKFVVE